MANMEIKKELKKKKAKARKRKEAVKKIIPIAIVLAVLSLAIILPITLSNGREENNESENSSSTVSTQYTILNLSSQNCPACNQLAPVMDDIRSEYSGIITVRTYDVNLTTEGARMGNKYNVSSIPTLVFLKNDQELSRTVGYRTKSQIESELRRLNWI